MRKNLITTGWHPLRPGGRELVAPLRATTDTQEYGEYVYFPFVLNSGSYVSGVFCLHSKPVETAVIPHSAQLRRMR